MQAAGIRGEGRLKPTQFGVLIDRAYALSEMIPVLEATKANGRVLWLDMESANTTDDTVWICEQLLTRYDHVRICLQAKLKTTPADLDPVTRDGARVRIVNGAYKETPEIAYRTRSEIDRAYLVHLETLFTRARHFAVGSHDGRMIDRALALSKLHRTPFEFAMLQGVRDPLKTELVHAGYQVAEYIPYGPNWLPYFTRRLRERPRNVITMIRSFVSGWHILFSRRPFRAREPSRLHADDADPRVPVPGRRLEPRDDVVRGPHLDDPVAEHDRRQRTPRFQGPPVAGRDDHSATNRRDPGGGDCNGDMARGAREAEAATT